MEQSLKPSEPGSGVTVLGLWFAALSLPLLYVLSIGPVAAAFVSRPAPQWVHAFYFPLEYLANNFDVFRKWLVWYIELWAP